MIEIRIHGRGGQGAQVGCQILAHALFRAGRWVQAFAAYGGERRGAPVTAYLRVADRPIRLRCEIERPDHALVLDASLLADGRIAGALRPGGVLVLNAGAVLPDPPLPPGRLVTIDAAAIAERYGLGSIVATAVVGAFVGATGLLDLGDLLDAVEEGSPARKRENVEACRAAFLETGELAGLRA
jgi:2-oxoacid:acceptor oxidoreductase gamma subunit (pyruvate/2-ketoisovalerate family)